MEMRLWVHNTVERAGAQADPIHRAPPLYPTRITHRSFTRHFVAPLFNNCQQIEIDHLSTRMIIEPALWAPCERGKGDGGGRGKRALRQKGRSTMKKVFL